MPTRNRQPPETGDARRQLIDALLVAGRATAALASRSLADPDCDISPLEYHALVVLASHGPQRVIGIATQLGVSSSTATRMCNRLVNKHLIRRSRTDTGRRQVNLTATESGRTLIDRVRQRRRDALIAVVDTIPTGWQPTIINALRSVAAALGEPHDRPPRPAPPSAAGAAMSERFDRNSGMTRYRPRANR
jgi:DNA-binding MarR family transcriptional regulator